MNNLPVINEIRLPCCCKVWGDPDFLSIQESNTGLRFKVITESGRSDTVYLDRNSLVELKEVVEERLEAMKIMEDTHGLKGD